MKIMQLHKNGSEKSDRGPKFKDFTGTKLSILKKPH